MKKPFVFILILASVISFCISYDFKAAAGSYLGSTVGAYIGENVAAPILILSSKIGLIDEDELFSPFSTLMYDAIDEGKVIGATVGGVLVKYIFFEKPTVVNVGIDLILSYTAAEVFKDIFGADNLFFVSGAASVELGVIW